MGERKLTYYHENSYELSNHLGNVLQVITDRKLAVDDCNGDIAYYKPDVVSQSDYYPGGMLLPNRHETQGESYRYSFNGMEKDDEIKGNDNSYTTEFRQYDPRVGRWLSIDPLAGSFPWQSPYVAFDNNPIIFNDPSGEAAEFGDPQQKIKRQNKRFGRLEKRLAKKYVEGTPKYDSELIIRGCKKRYGSVIGNDEYFFTGGKKGKVSNQTGVKFNKRYDNRNAQYDTKTSSFPIGPGELGGDGVGTIPNEPLAEDLSFEYKNVKDGDKFLIQAETFSGFQVEVYVNGNLYATFEESPQFVPDDIEAYKKKTNSAYGEIKVGHEFKSENKTIEINTGNPNPVDITISIRVVLTEDGAKVHSTAYPLGGTTAKVGVGRKIDNPNR